MLMHQYVELSHVYDDRAEEGDELADDSATAPPSVARTGTSSDATSPTSIAASEAETLAQIADDAAADPIPEDEVSDLALDAASEDARARAGFASGASESSTQAARGMTAWSFPFVVLIHVQLNAFASWRGFEFT